MQPICRICKICGNEFPPKNQKHVICSEDCRKIAAKDSHDRWVRNHPVRHKQNQQSQYKNRARDLKNKSKGGLPSITKRRCIYMVNGTTQCRRITGNNAQNRWYCDYHHKLLTSEIADDSFIFTDGGENLVEQFSESAR